jgi:hypothetical protein
VSPACPANCLPHLGVSVSRGRPCSSPTSALETLSLSWWHLLAASSLAALSASTSRHMGPAATSVSSAPSPRQDLASACLDLSFTLCKISILPLVLGLLLRICFPFLRRWCRTWPNASGSRQLEGGGYGPHGRIVGRLNGAPAATLEPEMSSISSRDQCLSMMRECTFCVSAGSESRLFALHPLRRSSVLLLGSTCPKVSVAAIPLELVADAGAVPADLCRDIGNWPSLVPYSLAMQFLSCRLEMLVVAHSF